MAINIQRVMVAAARGALEDVSLQATKSKRHLGAGKAILVGAGLVTAGRLAAGSRGSELVEELQRRFVPSHNGDHGFGDDEPEDEFDDPTADDEDEEDDEDTEDDDEEDEDPAEAEAESDDDTEPEAESDDDTKPEAESDDDTMPEADAESEADADQEDGPSPASVRRRSPARRKAAARARK